MKAVIAWVVCLSVTSLAHAELLVPRGAKAQLKVEYVFTSSGQYTSPAKDVIDNWSVQRIINMTAQYTANAPIPIPVLHANDAKLNTDLADAQARAARAQKNLQPMQNDIMAMAEKCGITTDGPDVSAAEEKAQEACMEKAATEYGNNMQMTPEIKSAAADSEAVQKTLSGARFQVWALQSQSGTYSIDENFSRQVTDADDKAHKRVEITKGNGAIPPPPGNGSIAGSSILEVDSTGRDMALKLPMPFVRLPITKTVTTTIVDDHTKGGPGLAPLWTYPADKPITVAIPADLKSLSGTQSFPIEGREVEAGTLTVKWTFTRN